MYTAQGLHDLPALVDEGLHIRQMWVMDQVAARQSKFAGMCQHR